LSDGILDIQIGDFLDWNLAGWTQGLAGQGRGAGTVLPYQKSKVWLRRVLESLQDSSVEKALLDRFERYYCAGILKKRMDFGTDC